MIYLYKHARFNPLFKINTNIFFLELMTVVTGKWVSAVM